MKPTRTGERGSEGGEMRFSRRSSQMGVRLRGAYGVISAALREGVATQNTEIAKGRRGEERGMEGEGPAGWLCRGGGRERGRVGMSLPVRVA